jgi:hypothetical protein
VVSRSAWLAWLALLPSLTTAAPVIEDAWLRATPPGAAMGAGYLVIDNTGGPDDRLLAVAVEGVPAVEIHRTVIVDGVARMRRAEPLDIASGQRIVLEPGGLHLMLMGLTEALAAGREVGIELRFESGIVKTRATIRPTSGARREAQ